MSSGAPDSVVRMAAALVVPGIGAAAPPGIDPVAFGRALVEDACDLVAELELVAPAVAMGPAAEKELGGLNAEELAWPGTPVLRLRADDRSGLVVQTLGHLAALGANQGAVLAADAPDLPQLLIGKLFRALGGTTRRADLAVCPAEGGGLVAVAAWLPLAEWVSRALVMDAPDGTVDDASGAVAETDFGDVVNRLHQAAPRASALRLVPGWHRLRSPADLGRLDPGLEGWSTTRGLLTSGR